MIVRCQVPRRTDGSVSEMASSLTKGTAYPVLGILVRPPDPLYFHVVRYDGTLTYQRADQFAVEDARIPAEWTADVDGSGHVDMGYPVLRTSGFLERFFDGDAEATRQCVELVARIYGEAGVPVPDLWTYHVQERLT